MYTTVLPLGDDVDKAMSQARFVAGLPNADEEVVAVLTHVIHGVERAAPKIIQNPARAETVKAAKAFLAEHDIDVEIREAGSPPAEGIVELADDVDADLIVISGRKRSPAGKAVFGSTTQNVILSTSRPVVVTDVPDEE